MQDGLQGKYMPLITENTTCTNTSVQGDERGEEGQRAAIWWLRQFSY